MRRKWSAKQRSCLVGLPSDSSFQKISQKNASSPTSAEAHPLDGIKDCDKTCDILSMCPGLGTPRTSSEPGFLARLYELWTNCTGALSRCPRRCERVHQRSMRLSGAAGCMEDGAATRMTGIWPASNGPRLRARIGSCILSICPWTKVHLRARQHPRIKEKQSQPFGKQWKSQRLELAGRAALMCW